MSSDSDEDALKNKAVQKLKRKRAKLHNKDGKQESQVISNSDTVERSPIKAKRKHMIQENIEENELLGSSSYKRQKRDKLEEKGKTKVTRKLKVDRSQTSVQSEDEIESSPEIADAQPAVSKVNNESSEEEDSAVSIDSFFSVHSSVYM